MHSLVKKYNVSIPRYTSYPTVPFWKEPMNNAERWSEILLRAQMDNRMKDGISIYIHLPFCEKLCTFCGCNKHITINHTVEEGYIASLLDEWEMYKSILRTPILIREIHLGGGTPTFFSHQHLEKLLNGIFEKNKIHPEAEFGFEGHPNNTTKDHLNALYNLGFRRVSFGVQDLDEKVQKAINRIQPHENVERVIMQSRDAKYESVNFDLVYGLPFQNLKGLEKTISSIIDLKPDRIAFYSYAHVPWASKAQRAYDENDLPSPEEKYALYQLGKEMFAASGYHDVGMDHFATTNDALWQSKVNGSLHRNFMGYTVSHTDVLIGLGVSAISDAYFGYRQNVKTVADYQQKIKENILPIFRGIDLTEEDLIRKKHILHIACQGKTSWDSDFEKSWLTDKKENQLKELVDDGLISRKQYSLQLTDEGWNFLRNVCALFDASLENIQATANPLFSKAV